MKRCLFAALAGSFLVLAGCSGNDGSSGFDGGSEIGRSMPPADSSMAAPALAPGQESGSPFRDQAQPAAERKEVVTGNLFVTTPDPIQASRDAAALVEQAGGRVDNRTENAETDYSAASSSLTARIPAEDLTGTVDRISALGEVTSINLTRDDVTMQYRDLDARTAALQASVDRLRALIAEATNTADLIEAESALSSRQGELDSLVSQRNYLADQVELSTITVQFDTDEATPVRGPDNFFDGVVAGWNSLIDAVQDGVVNLGRAIQWLGALTIGAGIVYGLVRVIRRKPDGAHDTDTAESADTADIAADTEPGDKTETERDSS